MKYLPLLAILLAVACVKEPVAWYYDVGVIEIISDTLTVSFNVPDTDTLSPGWDPNGNGEASKDLSITFREKAKKDVAITVLEWSFFDVDGAWIVNRSEIFVPPIEIRGGQEFTYTATVKVNEFIADRLDDADGSQDDFSGDGTIEFNVEGYDLVRGDDLNSIPSFTPIHVQK